MVKHIVCLYSKGGSGSVRYARLSLQERDYVREVTDVVHRICNGCILVVVVVVVVSVCVFICRINVDNLERNGCRGKGPSGREQRGPSGGPLGGLVGRPFGGTLGGIQGRPRGRLAWPGSGPGTHGGIQGRPQGRPRGLAWPGGGPGTHGGPVRDRCGGPHNR